MTIESKKASKNAGSTATAAKVPAFTLIELLVVIVIVKRASGRAQA
jgi:type II secretory pathway pseudopilin PulG